jgi:hypothetical protein
MRYVCLAVLALGLLIGCARQAPARPPAPAARAAANTSIICEALLGRFLGLPAEATGAKADTPIVGRWWVRRCDFGRSGSELFVRLGGPAWSWVDRRDPPFHLREHVYFRVDADLRGNISTRIGLKDGVASLWFRAARANVQVEPLGRVHPTSDNIAVSVVRFLTSPIPALDVDDRAREQLDTEVTRRFESALSRGFTMVYDIGRGQPDFGLGLLPAGASPEHPFADGRSWFVNERLIAAPGGVHVLGPFNPDEPIALDVRITSGSGLAWRAVCASDLESGFARVESGEPGSIPSKGILSAGVLSGAGIRTTTLSPANCPLYVVVSPVGEEISRAAIRVRHS